MNNLVMNNEEFKDTLYLTTKVKISFIGRLHLLFCPQIEINYTVYCKDIMPNHKAELSKIRAISYLDMIKWRLFQSKYHVMSAGEVLSKEELLRKKLDILSKKNGRFKN